MLQKGYIIDGRYKIIKEIGEGGMSTVYLAIHLRLNQKWAVKEIKKESCEHYELLRQSLMAEMNILKKLEHPNLPHIIDVFFYENSILIVMDYIEGKTLKEILLKKGCIEEQQILMWGKQLSDVLIYLHTRTPPIIYRDLKPSNIMLKPDGKIMLIDFGTAREYRHKDVAEDTICLGTRGYAAPEQYGGNGQTDERTDVYCFGVTLYYLLTGKNPEKPPYEIYPIRYWNDNFSVGLEEIIIKCTQADPEKRYQNTLELRYALEHVEENNQIFKQKEKQKVIRFLSLLFISIIFFAMGGACHWVKNNYKEETVESYIRQAKKAVVEEEVQENFKKALRLQPSNFKIYESILEHYIQPNDFDLDDAANMINVLELSEKDLSVLDELRKKNENGYCEFCYEVGIGYFYHMGDVTGKKEAWSWFQDVKETKTSDFSADKRKRAELYAEICKYYKTFIANGADKSGENESEDFEDFFMVLKKLNEVTLTKESSSSDAAAVYLISKEVAIEIRNYAINFLSEENLQYEEIKRELDKIISEKWNEDSRISLLKVFRNQQEIDELRSLIGDAYNQLYLAKQYLD